MAQSFDISRLHIDLWRGQAPAEIARRAVWLFARRLRQFAIPTALAAGAWIALTAPPSAHADGGDDDSGVGPQVISLPSGPGSLEGLGASFEPNLHTGTASYPVALAVAPGVAGFQPELTLLYNGGNPNGPWGIGWRLDLPSIQRHTDEGLPSYDDASDRFVYSNGEKLVALADGMYRFENEGAFMRFRRLPGGWQAHMPDGTRLLFGESADARETTPYGIFSWKLERQIDTHGNEIRYVYFQDSGYAYLREIRYNFAADGRSNAVVIGYEPRADAFIDRRSRAPIAIGLRATDVQVWALGRLVRIYRFDYTSDSATGKHALLQHIRQIGDDGVTELPATLFSYTQFDPARYSVVSMQNPPPVGLSNPDADLVDINADGLPDVVYTPATGHRFYLNRGNGHWEADPVFPPQSPPDRISSPQARMADMNGDGQADLLVKAGAGATAPFYYYAGQPERPWQPTDRVSYNLTPSFDLDDPNLRLVDMNNDKRIDVVLTTPTRTFIWLARADNTWRATADITVPTPNVGTSLVFADAHVKLGDMTGDRIQDLVYVRDGLVVYVPHNGNGDYDALVTMANPPRDIGTQDTAFQLGDLNGDGLDDLVLVGNRTVRYWLNLGDRSFADPIVLRDAPAYSQADTAVRLADVDGDGTTELLFSRFPAAEAYQYVDFFAGTHPFLLHRIDNGLGRAIVIDYQPSTAYYVRDWDAGRPWGTALPFPVQVVSRLTIHDASSGDAYVTDYAYRDGYYDGVQKEFRGFAHAEEVVRGDATAPTTVTRSIYDVGKEQESRKGLVLEMEILGERGQCAGTFYGCYRRQVNELTTRTLRDDGPGRRVAYSFVSRNDTFIHEQQAMPIVLRQTFDRDSYGNLTQEFNYGQVCGDDVTCGNDEVLKYTEYALNTDAWIVSTPARMAQTDAAGAMVSEARLFYDGKPYVGLPAGQVARGNLTRQEENLGPHGGNRFIPTKRQAFDAFGNVVGIKDANGNLTTVAYDKLTHTFPVLERIRMEKGKSLSYAAAYHHGFGTITLATDFNGHTSTYVYDTFGRLTKIVLPGDTLALPTQQFSYQLGSPRSAITSRQRERSGTGDDYTGITYFDGLGRKLQTRSEAEGGRVAVTEATTFNVRGGERHQFPPYYDTGLAYAPPRSALPHTTRHYDPIERVVRTDNPDSSFSSVTYRPLTEVQYDEEDNRTGSPHFETPKTLSYDGLERLVGVEEMNVVDGRVERYRTRYVYDPLGNLVEIVDAQGNVKRQTFDALGRKLRMDDPDRGVTIYIYDDNDNLVETRDAKGQAVRYRYDAADRPVSEQWQQDNGAFETVFAYHYDRDLSPLHPDALNTLGQLSYIEDPTGAVYFSYDARGNLAGKIRRYTQEELSFVTRMGYDAMDRLAELTYPDGSRVTYEYNAQAQLERIPAFVKNIDYLASGQRAAISYTNGVTTSYTYDSRLRLEGLRTVSGATTLQNLRYRFDHASNIVAIADRRPGRNAANDQTQSFSYDSLYRLTKAQGTYGRIDYGYDSIGNLLRQESSAADPRLNLGALRYGEDGAGPHALTAAGDKSYDYDANGNRLSDGSATYAWDPRDRLAQVTSGKTTSTYAYDASGERIRQSVRVGDLVSTTLYPDQYVELRSDQLIRYVFDGEQRVAQMMAPLDTRKLLTGFSDLPTQPAPMQNKTLWYVADHLGGTSLLLDRNARIVSDVAYYPYGLTRYERNGGDTRYRFTGKELDASGLYYYGARYYDPLVGHFISTDSLYTEAPEKGLTDPQSLGIYTYARNNPLRYTDPLGLDWWDTTLDVVQIGLDLGGLVPGWGEPADLINAGIYALRGDKTNAALSVAAAIPVAGWFGTGLKWVNKAATTTKAVETTVNATKAVSAAKSVMATQKPDVYLGALFRRKVTATTTSRGITEADREWARRIARKYGTIDGPPTTGRVEVGHVWGHSHVFTPPGGRAMVAAQTRVENRAQAASEKAAAAARRKWNVTNPQGPQLFARPKGSR